MPICSASARCWFQVYTGLLKACFTSRLKYLNTVYRYLKLFKTFRQGHVEIWITPTGLVLHLGNLNKPVLSVLISFIAVIAPYTVQKKLVAAIYLKMQLRAALGYIAVLTNFGR